MGDGVRARVKDGEPGPRPKALKASGRHPAARQDLTRLLAHDLKTPLAAIAMNLDFALSEIDAESRDGLKCALEDCRHANACAIRIVSDMADVVRLATGDYRPTLSDVDPLDLLGGVIRRAADDANARGVRIEWSAEGGVIAADPDLLARARDRRGGRAPRNARGGTAVTIEYACGAIVIRVESTSSSVHDANTCALATRFAEAALSAQGGGFQDESDGLGGLTYRVTPVMA
jgi:signal transduction histidine kinase